MVLRLAKDGPRLQTAPRPAVVSGRRGGGHGEMRFYLNSGQTSAVNIRLGLGGDATGLLKSPREYQESTREAQGKSYGNTTERQGAYEGALGNCRAGPSIRNAFSVLPLHPGDAGREPDESAAGAKAASARAQAGAAANRRRAMKQTGCHVSRTPSRRTSHRPE